MIRWLALAAWLMSAPLLAQTTSSAPPPSEPAPAEPVAYRHRVEVSSFDNIVTNGFGHWLGTGLLVSSKPSERWMVSGQFYSQTRPGETQQLFGGSTLINWSKLFYTDIGVSGGGPDDPNAFFPRIRYDANGYFKIGQNTGLIVTAGLTRLYFGAPTNGGVARGGAIYYWRRFVFQGLVNFNNARPGNKKSKSVNGAVQYGQEGRYWVGLTTGGGREAWQTLALTPQDVEFTSYSASAFLRKWLSPSYGVVLSYGYMVKRTAYRIHGVEVKLFLDF